MLCNCTRESNLRVKPIPSLVYYVHYYNVLFNEKKRMMVLVLQGMGYATLAGLSPEYGLCKLHK